MALGSKSIRYDKRLDTDAQYGMFVIMTPILMAPSIIVLYWGQWRAKKLGALAIADPGYAQRQALSGSSPRKPIVATLIGLFWQIDVVGLLLLAFGLGCFLVPFSLAAGADGGYSNRMSTSVPRSPVSLSPILTVVQRP